MSTFFKFSKSSLKTLRTFISGQRTPQISDKGGILLTLSSTFENHWQYIKNLINSMDVILYPKDKKGRSALSLLSFRTFYK